MLKFLKLLVILWLCKSKFLFYNLKYLGVKTMKHATHVWSEHNHICLCKNVYTDITRCTD